MTMKSITAIALAAMLITACNDEATDGTTNDGQLTGGASVEPAAAQEFLDFGVTLTTLNGEYPSPAVSIITTNTRRYLNFYQTRFYFKPSVGDTDQQVITGEYTTEPYRFQYSTEEPTGEFTPIEYEIDDVYTGAVAIFDQTDQLEVSSNYVFRTNNAAIPEGATHIEGPQNISGRKFPFMHLNIMKSLEMMLTFSI